jgi:hypothetical protein
MTYHSMTNFTSSTTNGGVIANFRSELLSSTSLSSLPNTVCRDDPLEGIRKYRVFIFPDAEQRTDPALEIARLAQLPMLDYEREREQAAASMGVRVSALDHAVDQERRKCEGQRKSGKILSLPEAEPWPQFVKGEEMLAGLSAAALQYVFMPKWAADTVALWVVHTYLLDVFWISPRLAICSPEKQCGKTTLLDVLASLVFRPLPTANVTASVVFRVAEMNRPTFLIDEADTFLADKHELRGILNSGHRRGGSVIRSVGDDFEPRAFSTYSACAIALIGKLPATLADRSLPVELRRRRPDELIQTFRFDRTDDLKIFARQASRWASDHVDHVRKVDPIMPKGMFNRTADNWRPLLAIADTAGGHWPERARGAVQQMREAATDDEQSERMVLLGDVRTILFEHQHDRISSADLVDALANLEGRPWAEWRAGKAITPTGVARLLAPFKIFPETIRIGDRTPKGYKFAQFEDAFNRYLPQETSQDATPQRTY